MEKWSALNVNKFIDKKALSVTSLPTLFGITPKQVQATIKNGTDNLKVVNILNWLNYERSEKSAKSLLELQRKLDFNHSELAAFLGLSVSKVRRTLSGSIELSLLELEMIMVLLEDQHRLNKMLGR